MMMDAVTRNIHLSVLLILVLVTCPQDVHSGSLSIGAFNIQVFGASKISKQGVVDILVQILRRYDIVLIQEIRDSSETAIYTLLDQVNSEGDTYQMVVSERLGRTSSKEQYAFMYKSNMGITIANIHQHLDPVDLYEREPYSVQFQVEGLAIPDFVLMAIHVKPDDAVAELNYLTNSTDEIKSLWNTENVMILGDLNADCSYVTQTEMGSLWLRNDKYTWWIENEADTTVSNSDCAYDRFISIGADLAGTVVADSVVIFRYDTAYGLNDTFARDVSDHYPIEIELYIESDTTTPPSSTTTEGSTTPEETTPACGDMLTIADDLEEESGASGLSGTGTGQVLLGLVIVTWTVFVMN